MNNNKPEVYKFETPVRGPWYLSRWVQAGVVGVCGIALGAIVASGSNSTVFPTPAVTITTAAEPLPAETVETTLVEAPTECRDAFRDADVAFEAAADGFQIISELSTLMLDAVEEAAIYGDVTDDTVVRATDISTRMENIDQDMVGIPESFNANRSACLG